MERTFKVTSQSKMYKELKLIEKNLTERYEFCKKFLKENNIESTHFTMGGNGGVDVPFSIENKSEIRLSINPTTEDKINFGKQLNKSCANGLRTFRKGSKLLKKFQNECIEKKVVINIGDIWLRDYFKSLDYMGYERTLLKGDSCYYLKLKSQLLKENDTPDGLEEIKLSEFYKIIEELE